MESIVQSVHTTRKYAGLEKAGRATNMECMHVLFWGKVSNCCYEEQYQESKERYLYIVLARSFED
jgi:hypothetical protein